MQGDQSPGYVPAAQRTRRVGVLTAGRRLGPGVSESVSASHGAAKPMRDDAITGPTPYRRCHLKPPHADAELIRMDNPTATAAATVTTRKTDRQPDGPSSGGGMERRRSPRESMETTAFLSRIDGTGIRHAVRTTDLSKHGVGFDVRHMIPAGTRVVLEIGEGTRRLIAEAKAVRCTQVAPGIFHAGAEFC